MENFSDRFKALLDKLEMKANEFAEEIGSNNVKVYKMLKGETTPNYGTIVEILERFPTINANYLFKGQLPMFQEADSNTMVSGQEDKSVFLSVLEPTNDFKGEVEKVWIDSDLDMDCANLTMVRVTDSTMAPRYVIGMKLLACPVDKEEWEYLNSTLVLVLYRKVLALRRIRENELLVRGYLTLYADAENAGFVHVKREDLKSIWRVVDIIGRGNDL
jgi:repressor LexA